MRTASSGRRVRAGSRAPGFTLLEVLAAFLVFAMLFTVLAGTAADAFRLEGENRRRLEASLLADEVFSLLEYASRQGSVPEIGESSEENDIFTLTTSVQPLTLETLGLDPASVYGKRESAANQAPPTSILSPSNPGDEAPLRRIDLTVTWQEGDREVQVTRSTFALDMAGIAELFPEPEGEGGLPADEEEPQQRLTPEEQRLQDIQDQLAPFKGLIPQ